MTPKQKLKKAARLAGVVAISLAIIDLLVLLTGLLQMAQTGESGHWSRFWRVQAEFLLRVLP